MRDHIRQAAQLSVVRAMSQTLSRVTSSGGAVSLHIVPGLIACTDARLFEPSSCLLTPASPFDTLRDLERHQE
jgi:hypothetical protein